MKIGDRLGLPCFKRFTPPENDYLIGWYKFNEGSGVVATNSAPLNPNKYPDLTVEGSASVFWGDAGFGHSPQILSAYAIASIIGQTFGASDCMGIFYKRTENYNVSSPPRASQIAVLQVAPGSFAMGFGNQGLEWTPPSPDLYYHWFFCSGSSTYDAPGSSHLGEWVFMFFDNTNIQKIIFNDGTLHTIATSMSQQDDYMQQVVAGMYGGYGAGGSFGDWLIYKQKRLTIAEWATCYDQLRSRYGMAARSGW